MRLCLALLAACAQPTMHGDERVAVLGFPAFVPRIADALIVIDDSAAMAPFVEGVRANAADAMESVSLELDTIDLHIGVISADLGDPRGLQLLSDEPEPDGTRLRNYTGDLGAAFAALVDVGDSGAATVEPLEVMRRALAGFRRPDDELAIAIVSAQDDDSSDRVSAYIIAAADADITVLAQLPAARLQAFAQRSVILPIAGTDWDDIDLVGAPLDPPEASSCFAAPLAEPLDCVVSEVTAGLEHLVPPCDAARPCWHLAPDSKNCPDAVELVIDRAVFPPLGTMVFAQCLAQ